MIVKQQNYWETGGHENTVMGALKWWIKNDNKHCRGFCPLCRYYFKCQQDVMMEREQEGE